MSERPQLAPALGLVRDRIAGPPPRRQAPDRAPVAAPEGTAEPDKPSAEREAVEAKPRKAIRPKASSASTGSIKRTTISIPQRLATSMRERLQVDRKVSQVQFILNAIEANAYRLADLLENERPAGSTIGGLFPDRSANRNAVEERTTINFDTTEANLKVIDSLVETHGADSRSQLVRVALRAVLKD